ncbi:MULTISPECIES: hypothetical protein [Burkholderiaceae]|uniref:hypothetical protein n=1 Tax=Burkholderiaceae TaxID=119060 RepID=UPI00161C1937|nr:MULTISPECIES: hypothetical protein [Burkholderiaceae]MBB2981372.1 hypothetical protein [Paraburkholderia tropica]MCA8147192.1 hypothetical protein [Burkholderia vietnamiensis]
MLYPIAIVVLIAVFVTAFRNTPSSLFGGQSLAQRFRQNLANARAERDARDAGKNANR